MDAEEVDRRIAQEAGLVLNDVIDISHHQSRVDFLQLRDDEGIFGVIHKASENLSYRDPEYKVREQKCRGVGLSWGAYHFGTYGDPVAQADHFLNVTGTDRSTLRALDFEPDPHGPDMTILEAQRFVTRVFEKTGVFPGFYSSYWHITDRLRGNKDDVLGQCWFWLAKYSTKAAVPPTWPTWTLWQYTDGAAGPEPHVAQGVGRCDRDRFNGGLLALKRLWGEI